MRLTVLSTLLLTSAVMGLGAGGLAAQELVGVVVDDATAAPLVHAKITVVGQKRSTVTDRDGYFTFKGLPTGNVSIRVDKTGYVSLVEEVGVDPNGVSLVRFQVPAVSAFLDRFLVVGHRRTHALQNQPGVVIQGGEHHGQAWSVVDLLEYRVPGLVVTRDGGDAGQGLQVLIRGVSSLARHNGPAVYVNGVRTHDLSQLQDIPASDVQKIRVLRGATSTTLYPDGANGVILIDTRGGPGGIGTQR